MAGRPVPPPRRLWYNVFRNIMRSFTPGYIRASSEGGGVYIGKDYKGIEYYEKPADPSRGRRIPTRYFKVENASEYCQEDIPAEWDSWLRSRRLEPPTEEEVARNLQIAMMKKENAARLAQERGELIDPNQTNVKQKFPVYEEYEINPGQQMKKR